MVLKLYHFTALEYLQDILSEGLTRGDVPLGPKRFANAVWLTRNPEPDAQGWCADGSHVLTDDERAQHEAIFGQPLPPGVRFPNKRAVMLVVEVPENDPNLSPWTRFARIRGVSRRWLRALDAAAGGGSQDWLVYRGTLAPEAIVAVVPLSDEARILFSGALDGPDQGVPEAEG